MRIQRHKQDPDNYLRHRAKGKILPPIRIDVAYRVETVIWKNMNEQMTSPYFSSGQAVKSPTLLVRIMWGRVNVVFCKYGLEIKVIV